MVVYNEYEAFASEAMLMFKSNPVLFRLVLKYRVDPPTLSTTTTSSTSSASATSTTTSTTTPSAVSSLASSTAAAAAAPGRLVVRATDSTRTLVFKTRELQDLKNCERLQLWLLNETATNESLFAKTISELAEEEKTKKKKNDKSQGEEAMMKMKMIGAGQKRQYPKMSGAQRRKARRLEKASLGPEGLAASRVKSDVERAREEKAAIKRARKAERRLTRQLSREQ